MTDNLTTTHGGSTTLELLAQYNDHRSKKDKSIEHIEKGTSSEKEKKPSYDEIFTENIKLKLQVQEHETEIESLKKVIDILQKNREASLEVVLEQVQNDSRDSYVAEQSFVLPPRSAERKAHIKSLNLPIPTLSPPLQQGSEVALETSVTPTVPQIDVTSNTSISRKHLQNMILSEEIEASSSFSSPKIVSRSVSSPTQIHSEQLASPAASVTYTTSRITIKSPNKGPKSPLQERLRSPQNPNRMTAVINNHLHSPLKASASNNLDELTESKNQQLPNNSIQKNDRAYSSVTSSAYTTGTPSSIVKSPSPLLEVKEGENKTLGFSPASKEKLDDFTQLLDSSFGEEDLVNNDVKDPVSIKSKMNESLPPPPAPPTFFSPTSNGNMKNATPLSSHLASPVILNKKDDSFGSKCAKNLKKPPLTSSLPNSSTKLSTVNQNASLSPNPPAESSSKQKQSVEAASIHSTNTTNTFGSTPQGSLKTFRRPHASSVSTVKSAAQSLKSDIPLFVQPEDFGTIQIEVLSTLYRDNEDDLSILIAIIDRKSGKEMFKFSKSIHKVRELDVYMKSHVPDLPLPTLPDRQLFQTLSPTKVDTRKNILNQYYTSIFSVPEFPQNVGLKIAQFISTDTVMTPPMMDDNVKDGSLLLRRPKTLTGNSTWRVRYGILRDDVLQLFDKNQLTETIKLRQSSIELIPNLPEDRFGTRNGFLITEHKKSGLSTSTKYYICTETSKERELWLSAFSDYIDPSQTSSLSNSRNANEVDSASHLSVGTHHSKFGNASTSSTETPSYVTDLTREYNSNNSISNNNSYTANSDGIDSNSSSYSNFLSSSTTDEEKDSRRAKMRSLFPFKKLTGPASAMNHIGITMSNDSDSPTSPDSIIKSPSKKLMEVPTSSNSSPVPHSSTTIFGSSLETCLRLSSHKYQNVYDLPSVVYRCLEYLYKNRGIQEEGIFRLSGSSTVIKTLQERFDKEYDVDLCRYNENIEAKDDETSPSLYIGVNTVSGLLKLYLRNLPHLLFGDEQFLSFKRVVDENHNNPVQISLGFKELIESGLVPHANLSLMYALFELLVRINENSKFNKMNLRNLCIVFSPTLNIPISMLQPFITDFVCIFQGGDPVKEEEREKVDIHIPQV
ncbi:GTPase-activating protein BEM3 [Saccharomyces paradoxus]|uniref:GTPase-activating protein BEM3 n=1 Tax=Saccharomyces paradoxus TaxID=27291 RepID=A0A8B8V101_SACPA|nr:Bem3 [Saccharomyces paradoxus]QHS76621.1 Bem3 [Saccharomyces paradoxus]